MSLKPALKETLNEDPREQQQLASDPTHSVWVNASAGSGKTTILTNRVARLLVQGVKPERILCLTFTRAAAAEMSMRVMGLLSQWAVGSDNELSHSLGDLQGRSPKPEEMTRARRLFASALACAGGLRIRTIHAFGQEVLRRFPVESGLPPHFTVMEETDARSIQEDVLIDLLHQTARDPSGQLAQAISILIDQISEKGFHELASMLLHERQQVATAIERHGSLENVIARLRTELNLEPYDSEATLIEAACRNLDEASLRQAASLLLQGTKTFAARGTKLLAWFERDIASRVAFHAGYLRCFLTADGDYFEKYGDAKLLKAYPELDAILRREATRLQSLSERCAACVTANLTASALHFGEALIESYGVRKRQQALLDYDDLVAETLRLLKRPGIAPWILHKLDEGLDHLLVDEAQDTSRTQWDIVATLADEFFSGTTAKANNRTLFVVGDEKQSIYSFQNADPEAFASMRQFFGDKIKSAEKKYVEVPLHVSFRSAPAVLRAVDAVFARDGAQDGVSAVPVHHKSFKSDHLFGRVELWPLVPQAEDDKEDEAWSVPDEYEAEHDPQAALADKIAETIASWRARHDVLPGMDRPIRADDVMILLRRRGRFADLMVRALKQRNVPVTGVDRMRLIEQLAVMDLLAVMRFVLLPEDDLNLANVLRGPLLNLSEEELMMLAAGRGEISLWQRLKNFANQNIYQQAHDYLTAWFNRADFMTPFAMLSGVLNAPCPGSSVSARRAMWSRLGADALDPIEELLNAAQNFSRRHAPSLQHFLHWLTSGDSEIKRELDHGKKDANVSEEGMVRIMTVHASKGLEAPIVFLPDAATVPRIQDVPKFVWDDAQGIPYYLPRKPETGAARRMWDAARQKQMQEYRRLLYVAMTRASHRLYVGGWESARREPNEDDSWYNLVRLGLEQSEAHSKIRGDEAIVWEDVPPAAMLTIKAVVYDHQQVTLPEWVFKPAPVEEEIQQSLSPSKLAEAQVSATPDRVFARGRLIHRLLQSLPEVEPQERKAVAQRFLALPQHGLSAEEQADVQQEVLRLIEHPQFAPLFSSDGHAEVPIVGVVEGQRIEGQVDRLAYVGQEIWIVDYKTNRPPPSDSAGIPAIYRAQMEAYRRVLRLIYPARPVRCFLLWTYGARLMDMDA